jgi:hypothetical protein
MLMYLYYESVTIGTSMSIRLCLAYHQHLLEVILVCFARSSLLSILYLKLECDHLASTDKLEHC